MKHSMYLAALIISVATATASFAQDGDLAPEMQCLRYLQSYERSFNIPQGLLTAISLAESGRPAPTGELLAWPWTINVNGSGHFFESKEEAVAATRKLLDEGQRSIDVGCMQVNLRYHPNAFKTIEEAFEPSTNIAYGAKFLSSLREMQGSWPKAVERYHSSDDGRREQYRERVVALWNSEARNIVMNAVLAEETDTPYHRAVRDFVAGRYADALDKYQGIVDKNPDDRIGLLGVAMSYEQLGRDTETMQAYARYLSAEPDNQNVLANLMQKIAAKSPDVARAELEMFLKAGVESPDVYATLAELSNALGDHDAALKYASDAVRKDPTTTAHYLNAAVLADRLNKPAAALQFYEQFLTLYGRRPVLIDTSIDGVRERVKFLRARL